MAFVLACVGFGLLVRVAGHVAGTAVEGGVDFKGSAFIVVAQKAEAGLLIGVQFDQPGLTRIGGAVRVMAGGTADIFTLDVEAVQIAKGIRLCQDDVLIVAHPTQTIISINGVRGLVGVHGKGAAQQGGMGRTMGEVAVGAALVSQPLGMGA